MTSRRLPELVDALSDGELFARLVGAGLSIEGAQRRLARRVKPVLDQLELPSKHNVDDVGAALERVQGLAHDRARSVCMTAEQIPAVHWRESGTGPVLVLLNGWSVSGLVWPTAWVERLSNRFRVVRIDNRGTGWSRRAPTPYVMADLAEDVVAVLDAIGAGTATVLGLSMGGMIAQELALRAPDRVERLVVVASRPPSPRHIPASPETSSALVAAVPAGVTVTEHLRGSWARACAPGFAVDHAELIDEMVAQVVARPTPRPFLLSQLRAVLAWRGPDRLEHLRVPTLVVHGDRDRLMPVGNGMRLAQLIAGAQYVELRGVGHLVPVEAGDDLATWLESA